MASIQLQQAASSAIVSSLFSATAAITINHPVGLFGGALFGAVHNLTHIAVHKGLDSLELTDTLLKTASRAASFFGSTGAAWYALALAGFSVTFTEIIILTGVSMLVKAGAERISHLFDTSVQTSIKNASP